MAQITIHGADIYAKWLARGGTLDSWKEKVAPILKKAGAGPLYSVSEERLAEILRLADA